MQETGGVSYEVIVADNHSPKIPAQLLQDALGDGVDGGTGAEKTRSNRIARPSHATSAEQELKQPDRFTRVVAG
jgi:hypothetical protein